MASTPLTSLKSTQVKHKTLSAYYTTILRLESCFEAQVTSLDDSPDYLAFVRDTLCATKLNQDLFPIKDNSSLWKIIPSSQRRSQQECVDWVMGDIARRGAPDILLKRDRVGRSLGMIS